jgi:hypothetical protein
MDFKTNKQKTPRKLSTPRPNLNKWFAKFIKSWHYYLCDGNLELTENKTNQKENEQKKIIPELRIRKDTCLGHLLF